MKFTTHNTHQPPNHFRNNTGIPGVLVAAALMAHAAQQVRLGQGRQREGDLLAMEVQGYVRQYVGLRSVVTGPFIKDDEVCVFF